MSHFSLKNAIRPNILALTPYRCARDDYNQGILLDANENALGHSIHSNLTNGNADLHDTDTEILSSPLHRYPDPAQASLKQLIADLRDLPGPEQVFLGVGSDEVIDLLMRITCRPGENGDAIMITPPTYGMYSVCAQINDVRVIKVPLNPDFSLNVEKAKQSLRENPQTKLLFLCSPGNPTGTLISLDAIRDLLAFPDFHGIIAVDEAYIDFSPLDSSAVPLVKEYPNLVVMQTLSKSFGLAAIRLGIAISQPPLIKILSNTKAPYNISSPTSILAHRALTPESTKLRNENISQLIRSRTTLENSLASIAHLGLGTPVGGGHANFVMIPLLDRETRKPDSKRAKEVYLRLAETKGVVVRYRGSEPGCDGCLRITVGSKEENDAVKMKMEEVLKEV